MTLRDLLDQVELQGPVSLLENTDNGSKILWEGYGCCLSTKAYLDREIAYIYPSYQDLGAGVGIEIK